MTATPEGPGNGRDDKDAIDAEFSRLMEGITFDESLLDNEETNAETDEQPPTGYRTPSTLQHPSAPHAPGSAGSLTGPTPAQPGGSDIELPNDLSSLSATAPAEDPNDPTPIAIVATPLASAKALAGVIRLAMAAEDDVTAIPAGSRTLDAESGAIVAGHLGEEDAHTLAHLTSLGLQRQGVVLFWRKGDRMTATRYKYGRNEGDVSPALVLGALSGEVEDLLLGVDDLDDDEETFDPGSIGRVEAMKWIASGRKKK